jgi:predicted DNA-binding transcriptional regulator AlpA
MVLTRATTMVKATPGIDEDQLLTEVQVADLLRLSYRTLQTWRSDKVGPPYVRVGRAIRYRRSDLIAWMVSNTVRPSQSLAQIAARASERTDSECPSRTR